MGILRKILAFFFPERCPYCGELIEAEDIACDKCLKILKEKQQPILRGALGFRCVCSFVYDGKVRRMLIRIKYYDRVQHIRQAAQILAKDIKSCYVEIPFDLITAVPMHRIDRMERGYNQSAVLAKELSKMLDLPYADTLEKVKRTKKQHHLKYHERKKNLSGAFRIKDKEIVSGRRILIVDDIVTSGYTLGTCCRTLARAKPRLICCAAIANADSAIGKGAVI